MQKLDKCFFFPEFLYLKKSEILFIIYENQEKKVYIYKTREILISSLSHHEILDTSRMLIISDIAFGFHFTFRLNFKNPQ